MDCKENNIYVKKDYCQIKLFVSDIDGTLLDASSKLSNNTINAIKILQKHNIIFCLGTGRNILTIYSLAQKLDNNLYSITSNGGLVFDHKYKKVIYSHTLTAKQSVNILKEIMNRGMDFICYSLTCMYYSKETDLIKERVREISKSNESQDYLFYKKIKEINEIKEIDNIYKIGVLDDSKENFDVINEIAEKEGAKLKNSGRYFSAIFPADVSKEIGLMELQNYLQLNPCNTIAIGDYDNDLPLFSRAKYKIAVDNASDNLKKEATMIIGSNKEEGVATFIKSILNE